MDAERRNKLLKELRKLRERRGMRPGAAAQACPELIRELGISPEELHERIVTTLRDMAAVEPKANSLIWAYGFDMVDPGSTTEGRRQDFAASLNPYRSIEAIKKWENDTSNELLSRLLIPNRTQARALSDHINVAIHGDLIVSYEHMVYAASGAPLHIRDFLRKHEPTNGWRATNSITYQMGEVASREQAMLLMTIRLSDLPPVTAAWAAQGADLFDLFGDVGSTPATSCERFYGETSLSHRFAVARPGHFYGLFWEF